VRLYDRASERSGARLRCSRSQVSSEWGSRGSECTRVNTRGGGGSPGVRDRRLARAPRSVRGGGRRGAGDLEAAPTGTHAPVTSLSARRGARGAAWGSCRAVGGCAHRMASWPPARRTCGATATSTWRGWCAPGTTCCVLTTGFAFCSSRDRPPEAQVTMP